MKIPTYTFVLLFFTTIFARKYGLKTEEMKMGRMICAIIAICLMTSCGAFKDAWNLDKNIKEVELGMSKKKVTSILGNSFTPVGAVDTPDGQIETIRYDYSATDTYMTFYIFNFKDGKLSEWHQDKERIRRTPHDKK